MGLLASNAIYFVSGQTQSSLAFSAFQASESSLQYSAFQASESSLAFAAHALSGKLDFDCKAYDCETKGIEVMCTPSSSDYDEETCPFAKYCCSTEDELTGDDEDVEVVISLDDTALLNLWLLVAAFILTNALMFYCFCFFFFFFFFVLPKKKKKKKKKP